MVTRVSPANGETRSSPKPSTDLHLLLLAHLPGSNLLRLLLQSERQVPVHRRQLPPLSVKKHEDRCLDRNFIFNAQSATEALQKTTSNKGTINNDDTPTNNNTQFVYYITLPLA